MELVNVQDIQCYLISIKILYWNDTLHSNSYNYTRLLNLLCLYVMQREHC